MAKSFKYKDDNYLDSTGIVHNKKLLSNILDTPKETTIWSNSSGKNIATNNNGTITLDNMPDLTNYENKKIHFYVAYRSDSIKIFTFIIRNGTYFIEYVRDYTGNNDIWHTLFAIYETFSTKWTIKSVHSYTITNNTTKVIAITANYEFYLYKITISDF